MAPTAGGDLLYRFEDYVLDTGRRELRRGRGLVPVEPQVFDLLECLIRNRDHVVSKDDLLRTVWNGRIVSATALTTCINAARAAVRDSGEAQRLIRTLPRKGLRFVGEVREQDESAPPGIAAFSPVGEPSEELRPSLAVPERPSIAVQRCKSIMGDSKSGGGNIVLVRVRPGCYCPLNRTCSHGLSARR